MWPLFPLFSRLLTTSFSCRIGFAWKTSRHQFQSSIIPSKVAIRVPIPRFQLPNPNRRNLVANIKCPWQWWLIPTPNPFHARDAWQPPQSLPVQWYRALSLGWLLAVHWPNRWNSGRVAGCWAPDTSKSSHNNTHLLRLVLSNCDVELNSHEDPV